MKSDAEHTTEAMSPPRFEQNPLYGSAEFSPGSAVELSLRGRHLGQHIKSSSGPRIEPSRSAELEEEERPPSNQGEIRDAGSHHQTTAPSKAKHPREMTFVELNYLIEHLPHSSERRQQAIVEIQLRPEYLEYSKSVVFTIDDEPDLGNHSFSKPAQFASLSSTSPIVPPPYIIDGLPRNLLPPPLSTIRSATSNGPIPSDTKNSTYLVPPGTKTLTEAEYLIQQALTYSNTHPSADLDPWEPSMDDPWAIPSPPGVPTPVRYVVTPVCDMNVPGDHTSFVANQAWLSADNLPPAMGFIDYLPPRQRLKGHVAGSVPQLVNALPRFISKDVEGWRLAYWFRRYPHIEIKDIVDRFYSSQSRSEMTKQELAKLCNAISMRHQRWCEKTGGFMFSRTSKKDKVSSKQLEIIERALQLNGFEGLERNMIWALDKVEGKMVQPKPKQALSFQANRFAAPNRAALKPRVEAAFQKYIWVVNQSRSQDLGDWRKLDRKVWGGKDETDDQANQQAYDHTIHLSSDYDVAHVLPSRAHTVPPAHTGVSFDKDNATQTFPPHQEGRVFSPHGPVFLNNPQRPSTSQRPQRPMSPQLGQRQALAFNQQVPQLSRTFANQHPDSYRVQSLEPVRHGLPLFPPAPGLYNDTRPATKAPFLIPNYLGMSHVTPAYYYAAENAETEMVQFDMRQLKDRNDFIENQNRTNHHLIMYGFAAEEMHAKSDEIFRRFTVAQRRNREEFTRAQSRREGALRGNQQYWTQNNTLGRDAISRAAAGIIRPAATNNIIGK